MTFKPWKLGTDEHYEYRVYYTDDNKEYYMIIFAKDEKDAKKKVELLIPTAKVRTAEPI